MGVYDSALCLVALQIHDITNNILLTSAQVWATSSSCSKSFLAVKLNACECPKGSLVVFPTTLS